MDETYLANLAMDYLDKINIPKSNRNVIKIIKTILDNKNLDIIRVLN